MYWRGDVKKALIVKKGGRLLVGFLRSKDIGVLMGQTAKPFGIAFTTDLRIPESGRFWLGLGLEISIKNSLSLSLLRILLSSNYTLTPLRRRAQKLQLLDDKIFQLLK